MEILDKHIIDMDKEEFKLTQTPLGGPLYKNRMGRGRPTVASGKKKLPTDRIKCEVCGKEYFRSGSTKHKRTVFHQERAKLNKKLLDFLID